MRNIKKYALCIIRNNRLLLQEQDGINHLVLPGGNAGEEEGAIQSLCRELRDELNIEIEINSLIFLGEFEDTLSEKDDVQISVDLYQGDFHGQMKAGPKVKNVVWFEKNDDWNRLTPVTRNKILPTLIQKGLLT